MSYGDRSIEEKRQEAIDTLQDLYARLGQVKDVNETEKLRKNSVKIEHIETLITTAKKILKRKK